MAIIEEQAYENAFTNFDLPTYLHQNLIELPIIGNALKKYVALTYQSELFDNQNITNIYYNRIYWFYRFKNMYFQDYGYNAGLEQQALDLLVECEYVPDVDLQIIEKLVSNHF